MQNEDEGLLTWQDLAGYTIEDKDAGVLGTIEYIDESTINTLATLNDGRLLPLHEDFITEIDEEKRILRVNLPFAL
jgi:16S rRNA processing protein RimM